MYSRISNPTVAEVEKKITDLEGGTGAILTSSGMAAILLAVLNITKAGQNIVSLAAIYGGTVNLFAVTLKRFGIEVRFATSAMSDEEIEALIDENTRMIFGETIANPALDVLDFDRFAALAHRNGLPFVVDNTFPTPILCRPFEHGCDIVVHSTTKWIDGHATAVGGVVVEGGNFDWNKYADKFPGMVEPDESYHGLKFYEKFGNVAFSVKLRAQMLRDLGCTMAPMNAWLAFQGLDTLHLRMERHSENAQALAEYLQNHEMVDWVKYPGLPGDSEYERAQKYLPKGASGVLAFGVKGGRAAGEECLQNLKLASIVVHVGDIRTSVLHPASTTHRQLSEEAQITGGILPELIRVSVGCEDIEDIIADFDQALNKVGK
jgi:O-acetylhomoserine (thiol)-lyase